MLIRSNKRSGRWLIAIFLVWLIGFIFSPKLFVSEVIGKAENPEVSFFNIRKIIKVKFDNDNVHICFIGKIWGKDDQYSLSIDTKNISSDSLPDGYQWSRASLGLGIRHIKLNSDLVKESCILDMRSNESKAKIGSIRSSDFVTGSKYKTFASKNSEYDAIFLIEDPSRNNSFLVISSKSIKEKEKYLQFSIEPMVGEKRPIYWLLFPFAVIADGLLCPVEWVMLENYAESH